MTKTYQKITSTDNPKIKLLEKLKRKKYRREFQKFAVENLAIILDALKSGINFEEIYITDEFADKHRKEIGMIENLSNSENFYLIDAKTNKYFSTLDTPSGITAVYGIEQKKLDNGSVIYLNGIADPGNAGTIMRSAVAFGFSNLVMDQNCVDAYNPKTVSAAKDAIFKLNILEDKSGEWLKKNKRPLYAADALMGESLENFQPSVEFCLVIGSESHGLSLEIKTQASKFIKIEISDKIESLNASVAAGIIMHALKRKKTED